MKIIELGKKKVSIVDDTDFEFLNQYNWCFDGLYARRNIYVGKNCTHLRMHRVIMDAPKGVQVDHKNGNKLDNRRANLRLVTHQQNTQNSWKKRVSISTSRYKGVSWYKSRSLWWVGIMCNHKRHFLGYFVNEIDAALAYDAAARELFGEYARLNFPVEEVSICA